MFCLFKFIFVFTILFISINAKPLNNIVNGSNIPDSDDHKRCPSVNFDNNKKSGNLFSPQYPSKYPNNSNCTYALLGEAGKKVKITFEEFDLEQCCDFVYLYDGIVSEHSKIKRLSGKHKKGTSFETKLSNVMIVKFTSDANFRFKGFKAKFDSV
uniref:CUB domain-containing protein n=1 Tax=Panagrolaimus sp. PS1159 TaxID=55785 RepID=A0AC35FQW0_9BILA